MLLTKRFYETLSHFSVCTIFRCQVLEIKEVTPQHGGMYMCKAEAKNPAYRERKVFEDFNPPRILIQVQPIRGIVFVRPHILPGSPSLVPSKPRYPSRRHSCTMQSNDFPFRSRNGRDAAESASPSTSPTPSGSSSLAPSSPSSLSSEEDQNHGRFFNIDPQVASLSRQHPKIRRKSRIRNRWYTSDGPPAPVNIVAWEDGRMTLECAVRGWPNPHLMWFRGGVGSAASLAPDSNAITFDQNVKVALRTHNLVDIHHILGTKISDDDRLFETVGFPNSRFKDSEFGSEVVNEAAAEAGGGTVTGRGARIISAVSNSKNMACIGRFSLQTGVINDTTGRPVLKVSRLVVDNVMPQDATRYTCLALLDLEPLGGHGNFTDVGR
ncbi:unnamed protein product [Protopolystoma xenopodis]|uniref:Ig-like domain-containing protein n=1 Tax=Protopolystoma xenopodis TaxID=117903 RepID=A0A448WJ37_9PLAT|nr:unnamed protein product [Protopolystoma xenopodis]